MSQTRLQPWQVTASTIVHQTPWIQIVEDECTVNEKTLTYTYTRRVDEGPLIIAEDIDQKLWLVRQYRHPIKKIIWQFPAEGKHPEESWEHAAARGLEEELQLKAETWHDLGLFYPDPGGLDQKYHVFLATNLSKNFQAQVNQHSEEVENLEINSFSRSEIEQLINSGELCDNWTLSGLFLYDRYKKAGISPA